MCSCVDVFAYYTEGMAKLGIRKSIESAKRVLKRAAMCGHAGAQNDLARYNISRKKIVPHVKKEKQIELAREEGYNESFYHLGNIFRYRQYEKQDLY